MMYTAEIASYVPPSMLGTKFHTHIHIEPQAKLRFV
jgi:hypothetical protein